MGNYQIIRVLRSCLDACLLACVVRFCLFLFLIYCVGIGYLGILKRKMTIYFYDLYCRKISKIIAICIYILKTILRKVDLFFMFIETIFKI